MFRRTKEEAEAVRVSRSQIVTLKRGQNAKYLAYAFTEYGALMAANILNSSCAVQMSIFVVRAFAKMREGLLASPQLAKKLAALEKKLTRD
jgi:phage regulator Rha-like protein